MGCVGQVVEFRTEFEFETFGDREDPKYRQIVILQARGSQDIAARVAETVGAGRGECLRSSRDFERPALRMFSASQLL